MRLSATAIAILLLITACGPSADEPATTETVVERYADSTRRVVEVRTENDSLVERRFYRRTGALRKVERGDSIAGYLDLHEPDSARVLQDYLQGRWRNTSASMNDPEASAFYVFEGQSLTFRNPSDEEIESIGVTYNDHRTITTEDGYSATADIADFDTVTFTGYTLVRQDTTK